MKFGCFGWPKTKSNEASTMEETEPRYLPEAIIHRIQNYLSKKEAARTCLLSKSWYKAWCTRTVINIDERDFRFAQEFSNFSRKTLLRYKRLHLNLENFELFMRVGDVGDDSSSLASELIVDALKLNVSDLRLEIIPLPPKTYYVLPVQVFAATSLTILAVHQCKISGLIDGGVICSNLVYLSLFEVFIEDDMIRRILLGCPLIENLRLFCCMGFRNINVSEMHKLREVSVVRGGELKIEFEERRVGSVLYGQVNVPKFRYLSSLVLDGLNIGNMFFHEFSHKFPCLEDLTLADCHGSHRDIQISSHSLKCISLTNRFWILKKARFDVPSIRKFKFLGETFPSLSFTTASREWESDITLIFSHDVLDVSWFRKLRNFLAQLSFSRISLSLKLCDVECDNFVGDIRGSPVPVVEILIVKGLSSMCYSLLNGLFWSCRPNFITECGVDATESRDMNWRLLGLLRKTLRKNENQSCVHDLEEAIPEFFEKTLLKWQPFPPDAFTESKIPERKEHIRIRLTWGPV